MDENLAPYIEEVDKPIDYKYYLFLIRKRLFILITFFVITVTLAAIYSSKQMPDRYKTFSQIIVEQARNAAVDPRWLTGVETTSWRDDYYVTQQEIMSSAAVMRQVVEDLNLTSYFGSSDAEAVANRISGMVKVHRLKESRLFNIYATAQDPQLAQNLANAVARAYIRVNFENRLHYSQEVLGWLPQADGDPDEVVTIKTPFGKFKQVTRQEILDTMPVFRTDATLKGLRDKKAQAEADLSLALKRFREKHPTIIKMRSNLKFIDDSIESERASLIESLKLKAEGRHQIGQARIIEEAPLPASPIRSERKLIVLIAAFVELFLSILIVILLDFFDDTIRSVEDMERKGLILPFLGPVSMLAGKEGSKDKKRTLVSFHDMKSDIAESFRYLRVAINFSASPEALKNLIISSCLPSEGKSFISHNLAISLALDGNKTLLVDCDLRRPVLHQAFNFDNSTGISNYLTSDINFDDVVRDCFVENLHIVGSGPMSPNPGEILGSQKMKDFLKEAQQKYDRVIIDCPPLTGIGDGFVIGSLIGHVIMVIAAGKTPAELVKRTQTQLDKAGIKILGTILNMVDMQKERYGGYYKYYYHTYNRYYNQEEEK